MVWWIVGVTIAILALAALMALRPSRHTREMARLAQARKRFHEQREWLEAKFFDLASRSGKPRGLRWVDCDFEDEVSLARDVSTSRLTALVGVTIRFEAIEGGGMEEVEAVSNLRAASSVFQLNPGDGRWHTAGRVIYNLRPEEAIRHFQGQLEQVGNAE